MKRTWLALWLLVFGLLAACGGNAATTGTSAPAPEAAEETAAAESEAASEPAEENALSRIQASGKLIIATSGNFRPVTFMNESGQLDGLDIEIGKLIAKELGVEAEFVPGNISGLIPGLVAGKFDLVMSGLLATDERKKSIDFSIPYGKDGTIGVVKAENTTIADVTKLEGLVVGVIGGSGTHSVVTEIGGYKELKEYPGNAEAFTDLKAGRIDIYATGRLAANDFIKNDKTETPLKLVGEVHAMKDMGVGINKGEEELKAAIDAFLQEKLDDGTIDELAIKWTGAPLPK